jgi:hypothetical protein
MGRRHITTGFMAGELDPHLDGRIDTDQYAFGLSICENWVAINEGPLVKRQGFEYVAPAAATAVWLTAFRPSIEQEYVLEWSNLALRFYTNEARIETSPGTAYQVTTPYPASVAPFISAQQSFDRQYLAHGSYAPRAIRRETPTTFALETTELIDGPFLDVNTDTARTLTVSAVSGTGITISGNAGFVAGHIGALLRIEAKDFADITQWEAGMKGVTIGQVVRNGGRVYQAASAGTTGTFEPIHSEGGYWDGMNEKDLLNDKGPYGVRWVYRHDRFGIVRITAVASTTSATGDVVRRLPDSLTSVASEKWAHQAFSIAEGWPSLVALFKGRLIHFKGIDILGSVAGDFAGGRINYAAYAESGRIEADLAFRRTISISDPPLWVSADRQLLIGTANLEMAIGPQANGTAFSGTNIEADPQSYYGSQRVFPVKIGTETVFVERGGRRVRSADYDFGRDRYDAPDLNATSRHITAGGIVQLGYQRVPHALVFGVRGDGQVIVHAKTRAEIRGWTRWKLGGGAKALSGVAIVNSSGQADDIWLLVERTNGAGAAVREVWKQARWRELGDPLAAANYLDASRSFLVPGNTATVSVPHLASQEVAALVNGVVIKGLTVAADGTFTIPADLRRAVEFRVTVGLPYTAIATPMRPELRDGRGSLAGLRQRATKLIARVLETLGLRVAAPGQTTPEDLILRRGGQRMDEQITPVSEDVEGLLDADIDRDGRTTWTSDVPLPATIALVAQNMEVSEADA